MRTFHVYKHATEGYETVKVGFSWPAFFFGIIWMLVSELWLFAAAWFAIWVALKLVEVAVDHMAVSPLQALLYLLLAACQFALWLLPAFKGNTWRDRNLVGNGYELVATVQAASPTAATSQVLNSA